MKYIKGLGAAILLILLDQLAKYLAVTILKPVVEIPLIPGVLSFYYHENRGAVWGLMQGSFPILGLITVFILIALIWFYCRIPDAKKYKALKVITVFLMAGAAGNLIDRVFRHFVVDFIYFKLIDFPIFNVADIYVTVSAFLLILLVAFYYKDEHDFDFIFSRKAKAASDRNGTGE
ncbi:MAG TPA: signal peptidase II [Candidatus Onthocola gallistercoris]|uniref:Lipoprotein signal peptidase n=1 Tax=Candidatus Onthocola gallistercoris TaxID=2840876 RepID=A0A9D1KWZ7_9FIRM|nr:signal peptidase II [Candidatus Onthocola gallistercoris]